jgi:hypothetical protein
MPPQLQKLWPQEPASRACPLHLPLITPAAPLLLLPARARAQRLAGGAGDGERPPATVGDLRAVPLPRLVAWLGDDAGQW